MNQIFHWPVRVYYEDTDALGVVYHANYLGFMERARNEWLRELGYSVGSLQHQQKMMFVMKRVALEYHAPARLDDLLNVSAEVLGVGRTSMRMRQQISRDDTLLVEAELVFVVVDSERFRPVPIPDFLRPDEAKNTS